MLLRSLSCIGIVFVTQTAFARHCPPRITETLESSSCRWSQEEPNIGDVVYDGEKKTFSYTLGGYRTDYYLWQKHDCRGNLLSFSRYQKHRNISKTFVQSEEGHADFTVIREVRQFLKSAKGTCE